jgi:predicted metal-dependent phosphoesterase TrpH
MQYSFYFLLLRSYYEAMSTSRKRYIDLHMHSNFSDGAFSPTELVDRALTAGLETIAIADHDSVAGVAEGDAAGRRLGVEVIPAVELSVQFGAWKDVHLLGYGIDYTDRDFLKRLNAFRERRERRNIEILDLVNERLVFEGRLPIRLEEVLLFARETIGRPHIARAMMERGYVDSVEDAFRRYLVPCNVPKCYWPIDDAITEIRRLGGVAVLAHPTSIVSGRQQLHSIVAELAEMGMEGIEAFNNMAQPDEMEFLRRMAAEMGLLVSGGSDFHGIEDRVEMGRGRGGIRFDESLLIPLKDLLEQRKTGSVTRNY